MKAQALDPVGRVVEVETDDECEDCGGAGVRYLVSDVRPLGFVSCRCLTVRLLEEQAR